MPRKLRYSHDAPIQGRQFSIFVDEETGQQLSIPHAVEDQAALDPISVADRLDYEARRAAQPAPTPLVNQERSVRMANPQGNTVPVMPDAGPVEPRARLQGVLDTFEQNRPQARYDRYSMDRMPAQPVAPPPDDRTYGSFFDELEQLKKQARGGK
jgi:hypothetical protein